MNREEGERFEQTRTYSNAGERDPHLFLIWMLQKGDDTLQSFGAKPSGVVKADETNRLAAPVSAWNSKKG